MDTQHLKKITGFVIFKANWHLDTVSMREQVTLFDVRAGRLYSVAIGRGPARSVRENYWELGEVA